MTNPIQTPAEQRRDELERVAKRNTILCRTIMAEVNALQRWTTDMPNSIIASLTLAIAAAEEVGL